AAERMLGYRRRAALGRPSCELFGGETAGRQLCYRGCHGAARVMTTKICQSFDVLTATESGEPIWININALSLPPFNGQATLTLHLMRDVTDARRLLGMVDEWLRERGAHSETAALTRRERDILRLLSAGLGTKTIAEELHVSRATVRNHVQRIFEK